MSPIIAPAPATTFSSSPIVDLHVYRDDDTGYVIVVPEAEYGEYWRVGAGDNPADAVDNLRHTTVPFERGEADQIAADAVECDGRVEFLGVFDFEDDIDDLGDSFDAANRPVEYAVYRDEDDGLWV